MSSLDDNPQILLVRKHLVEHLGPPEEVFEVTGSPLPNSPVQALNLAYFAPQGPAAPVVFASCGASLFQMKDGRRVEALVLLRREPQGDAFEAVHRLLGSFALFPEENDEVIQVGDVVKAPEDLTQFCRMDAVLFMPPVPFVPSFHKFALSETESIEMIWLLPVYQQEAEYAIANGPQALMMLFAAQGVDLTEPQRDCADTSTDPKAAEEQARDVLESGQAAADKPAPRRGGRPKTARRDVGRGSFDVEEGVGGGIKISRRGGVKKAGPSPAAIAAKKRAEAAAAAKAAAEEKAAKNIRFDLDKDGRAAGRGKVQKQIITAKPKAAPLTAEQKAAEKKDRVAALKAQAKAAAARAAERKSNEMKAAPPSEPEQAAAGSSQAAAPRKPAAPRRPPRKGAPRSARDAKGPRRPGRK